MNPDIHALPAERTSPSREQIVRHLLRSNEVAKRAISIGCHPFGAILVAPDHETVLIEQCNIDTVNHAEAELARIAARNFPPEYLWHCTLYTSVEPCCMCAGGAYWAGIGALVFGLTEKRLAELTGDNPENLTMDMPCRAVFAAGQRKVEVRGPDPELEEEIVEAHRGFW